MGQVTVTEIPLSFCGSCGERLQACSGPGDAVPKPGDVSICAYCGGPHQFLDDMRQRLLSIEELNAMNDFERRQIALMILNVKLHPLPGVGA